MSPVKRRALELGINLHQPATLRTPEALELLRAAQLDVLVVVAYGLILPAAALGLPKWGCINIHASLLPRWRGAAPIQRALLAGDSVSGVTIMRMEAGLDTGPMLASRGVKIGARETAKTLHDRLAALGADLIAETVTGIRAGNVQETPQPAEGVTYAAKIDKAEARIDWAKPARAVLRHIHGLSPFPGAWCETTIEGAPARVKILRCALVDRSGAPGELLDDHLAVACKQGAIRILELQRAGKTPMKAEEFLRGTPLKPPMRLS